MKFDRLSDQARPVSGYGNNEKVNGSFLKHTLLLTVALFLIMAPAPDAYDVKEMTANFIVPVTLPDFLTRKTGE
jgi:hypothetical protein